MGRSDTLMEVLPPLDWDLFDMKRITQVKKGWLSILTSRGCPYKCTYCFNREIVDQYMADKAIASGKEYLRHHPIPDVLAEIRRLKAANVRLHELVREHVTPATRRVGRAA